MRIPFDVLLIAVPLLIYFVVMFLVSFWLGYKVGADYSEDGHAFVSPRPATILSWRLPWRWQCSESAPVWRFAAVIGPLVEVPVMIGLVRVARCFQRRYFADRGANGRRKRSSTVSFDDFPNLERAI